MKHLAQFIALISLLFLACKPLPTTNEQCNYTWKNVQIVGGGFVDGIIFHPTEKNLRYARTDMGGAYRWEEQEQQWKPLMDWVSYDDNNLMGVESIALDQKNPDLLYLACGTYTNSKSPNGEILISYDRGNTFKRVKVPFKMGGNENGRGNGERMAVDPANGNIIYLGTRHNGLWKSEDAGLHWNQVNTFPIIHEEMPTTLSEKEKNIWHWALQGSGIVWVVFDPASANAKGCETLYAAYSLIDQANLFRSTDGGKTWNAVPGQPTQYRPTHGVLATNGMLYISYGDIPGPIVMNDGGVWKYDTKQDTWTNITPNKPEPEKDKRFGYAAVAVDASDPDVLLTSVFHRSARFGGDDIYRSTDGGQSWRAVFANGTEFDYSKAPYVQHTPIHWLFDVEIDPSNADHAIFTTGFGGFETYNLTNVDKGIETNWSVYTTGIEETVPLTLCSPPVGAQLISGIGDYAGFVHWDIDQSLDEQYFTNPSFGNCDWVTCAALKPELIVRVGIASRHQPGSNIGYSFDFGKIWQPAKMPTPESQHGTIAVSANGATWVWTPENQQPFSTYDKGETWTLINELPTNIQVVSDMVNPGLFYAIDLKSGLFYHSTDSAKTFTAQALNLDKGLVPKLSNRGDIRGGQDRIYATPGYENDKWIAAFDGLYHSAANNSTFTLFSNVTEIHGFGFGKEAPGNNYPTLYLIGSINQIRGIYRSDDKAQNWVRINDNQHQWGLLLTITGDPKKYGRVYIGSHGRGIIYGDISN